ncbi:signal peptidase I [Aliikangiella maris]|uniref:Signal peptidase I n=2 Tax=Aliikangiella maris TaxID=3162458 RepID=A0ABV3MJS0_9GAMM
MDNSYYQPGQAGTVNTSSQPPKSFILALIFCILGTPFCGMLYLGRFKRGLVYLAFVLLAISTFYADLKIIEKFSVESIWLIQLIILLVGIFDCWRCYKQIKPHTLMPLYSRWYVVLPYVFGYIIGINLVKSFLVETYQVSSVNMAPNYYRNDILYVDKRKSALTYLNGNVLYINENSAMYEMAKRGNTVLYLKSIDSPQAFQGRIIGVPGDTLHFTGHSFEITHCNEQGCNEVVVGRQLLNNQHHLIENEQLANSDELLLYEQKIENVTFNILHNQNGFSESCQLVDGNTFQVLPDQVFIMGDNRDNSYDSRFFGMVSISNIIGEVL